jgi:hypothetical protein
MEITVPLKYYCLYILYIWYKCYFNINTFNVDYKKVSLDSLIKIQKFFQPFSLFQW